MVRGGVASTSAESSIVGEINLLYVGHVGRAPPHLTVRLVHEVNGEVKRRSCGDDEIPR